MKVSLNWAQWYSDTDLKANSTDELVTLATERLGGVEGVSNLSKHYEGIVVAKVVSCEKHPNADKLNLCQVEDGGTVQDVARDENGYVQVVCGAPNVREDRVHRIGQKDSVQATYFLGNETIDQHIYEIIEKKRLVANEVTGTTDSVQREVIDKIKNLFN